MAKDFDLQGAMSNPLFLASMGVLSGKNFSDAMTQAATQSAYMQESRMRQDEYNQQKKLKEMLPQMLNEVDITNPNDAMRKLVSRGVPVASALEIVNTGIKFKQQQRLQQEQDMLSSLMGGGQTQQQPIQDANGVAGQKQGVTIPGQTSMQTGGGLQNVPDEKLPLLMAFDATREPAKFEADRRQRERTSQKEDSNKNRDLEYKIVNDFDAASKPFIGIRDGFANMRTAARDNSAVGDIQLIYSFMKTQDPNSTVREGEFATAQNAGGIPEWVRNSWNRALSGERLSPDLRQKFVGLGQKNYDVAQKQHEKLVGEYQKRATRFGLNPDNITSDFGIVDSAPISNSKSMPSMADLEYTAKKYGLTPEQVRKKLGM